MDKKVFTPSAISIKELFQGASYSIPDYQRLYSWTDDQIDTLWYDLFEAYENKTFVKNYFLGSIITVPTTTPGLLEVVDGQQRITTLTLLLATLNEMVDDVEDVKEYGCNAVTKEELESIYLSKRKNDTKLRLQKQERLDVEFNTFVIENLSKLIADNNFKKPKSSELKGSGRIQQIKKYENAVFIFRKKIDEILKKQNGKIVISQFINYLFNSVYVIKVECEDTSFAIKLFQVINDTGLDLSIADVVKSYILGSCDNEERSKITQGILPNIEEDIANLHSSDLSNYIVYFMHYLLEATPKLGVTDLVNKIINCNGNKDSLKVYIPSQGSIDEVCSAFNFIRSLWTFISNYKKIYDLKNKDVYAITILPWENAWVPILSAIEKFNYSKKEKEELFFKLKKYFYINYIANKTYNQIKQTSLNILSMIKEKKSVDDISALIEGKIDSDLIKSFKISLKSRDVYSEKWIKPLFVLIEYHLQDSDNRIIIDNYMHAEHILPVKWETNKNEEWNHIDKKTIEPLVYSLGNLTLLNYKKNIFAQNEGFKEKVDIYAGRNSKILDGKTSYVVTQKIISDYDENRVLEWNEDEISKRAEWLTENILKILGIEKSLYENIDK